MFRQLIEAAPDAMVIVDGCGQIVPINRQAEELSGYPREELLGQPVEVEPSKSQGPELRGPDGVASGV
jgi:PAS domain S-box-containing protein